MKKKNKTLQSGKIEENQGFRDDKRENITKEDFDLEKEFPEFKGWEEIGFQRPLGRELWEVTLEMINNSLYIFVVAYLIPLLQPFPVIIGYNAIAGGLFSTIYIIFDTGTNFSIYRFIAEYRI
ncbi:MAG: hypothetical protein ACTSVI_14920, partial [Promethearchaeota archaeon]